MARSIVSFGMLASRALSTAVRRRGLPLTSAPPRRAEMVNSLITFVHIFDFLASVASFLCLIFDQRLCPDMADLYHGHDPSGRSRARRFGQRRAVPGVLSIAR